MNYFEKAIYNNEYEIINNAILVFAFEKICDEIYCNVNLFVFRYKKNEIFRITYV